MKLTKLENPLQTFVLADSLEKKDTTGTLGFIKSHVLNGMARVREKIPGFSLKSPLTADVLKEIDRLDADHKRLLKGSLLTRDLTREGVALFQKRPFDHQKFGALLTAQHEVLRDLIQIATPKIERMIRSALDAGAFGAKINGSGGGGCMFAYAPNEPQKVAAAVEQAGGQPYIVHLDEGARREV
jgi:galactokinase